MLCVFSFHSLALLILFLIRQGPRGAIYPPNWWYLHVNCIQSGL